MRLAAGPLIGSVSHQSASRNGGFGGEDRMVGALAESPLSAPLNACLP
jgi:hypothetical protein